VSEDAFWESNLILRVLCGSRAYGLDTPESDTDSRGVCIPPPRLLLGLSSFEQHESPGCDHVVYSLQKFARLALAGNPNIIETLFTDRSDVLFIDAFGERLVAARERMLSRRVGERFMGYALAQRKRIEGHHRWLETPPEREPKPTEFGGSEEAGKVRWATSEGRKEYKAAHKKWTQYVSWRAGRNPKRAALEDAYGYDTKHAQHLCRLLTMGEEILRDGEVRVRRPDAEFLRSVRGGALSYDELTAWIDERVERLPALAASSPLPEEPDHAGVEALVVELQREYLFG
jgi:uncharacterized protein